jgi:hypothetical protein
MPSIALIALIALIAHAQAAAVRSFYEQVR